MTPERSHSPEQDQGQYSGETASGGDEDMLEAGGEEGESAMVVDAGNNGSVDENLGAAQGGQAEIRAETRAAPGDYMDIPTQPLPGDAFGSSGRAGGDFLGPGVGVSGGGAAAESGGTARAGGGEAEPAAAAHPKPKARRRR